MRGAKPLFGVATALCALTPLASVAADLPAKTAASASETASDPNAECGVYGPKFFKLGDNGFCGKAGYDVMVFGAKDFAKSDIAMVSQRSALFRLCRWRADALLLRQELRDADLQSASRRRRAGQFHGGASDRVRRAGRLRQHSRSPGSSWPPSTARSVTSSSNSVNGSILQGLVDQAWIASAGSRSACNRRCSVLRAQATRSRPAIRRW